MISLITGLPGSGKTSLMVHMLMTRADLQNRPLFVDGIKDLKLQTMQIPENESMETWHNWAPTGAILVIDEAQRIFRPRPAGSKVPEHIQELETHRHKGIDIFVLTQHPRLIDVNLRSLIGEHRNISRTMIGLRRLSYWQRCANPESRNDLAEAKNSIFTIKKDAFKMYKSAEEHTKLSGSLSAWVWLLPLVMFVSAFLIFYVMGRYDKKISPEQQKQQVQEHVKTQTQVQVASGIYQDINQQNETVEQQNQNTVQSSLPLLTEKDFEPSIAGQPWTAPIYNSLNRNIQSMPFPVLCVKSKTGKNKVSCNCYTEQSTLIREISKAKCIDYAENGIFNPYKQVSQTENVIQQSDGTYTDKQPENSVQVLTLSGKPLPSLSTNNSEKLAVVQ